MGDDISQYLNFNIHYPLNVENVNTQLTMGRIIMEEKIIKKKKRQFFWDWELSLLLRVIRRFNYNTLGFGI